MKTFIALYHNTSGVHQAQPELTDEQKEQMLAPWGAWAERCGDRLVEMGSPVMPAVCSDNGTTWSPSKNFVTGYSIVSANSLAEAQEMFKGHPIYGHPDHSVEISEAAEL